MLVGISDDGWKILVVQSSIDKKFNNKLKYCLLIFEKINTWYSTHILPTISAIASNTECTLCLVELLLGIEITPQTMTQNFCIKN